MDDLDETNRGSLPKGDIFIPFKVRNTLFFDAEMSMSKLEVWVAHYSDYDKKMINQHGTEIIEKVKAVVDNTRATMKKSIIPPPMNQIKKIEGILKLPWNNDFPLEDFCEAWKTYHDLMIEKNIIPNTVDLPSAFDRMMR